MDSVNQHLIADQPPIAFLDPIPSSPPPPPAVNQTQPQPSGTQETRPKKPKQKPHNEERTKGHSLLPLAKVQRIMKTEHEIAMSSKEAVFLVAAAAEEFMKRFAIAGHKNATEEKRTVITQGDMANAAHNQSQYNFLQETIPRAISITEALRLRDLKQKEDAAAAAALEDEPLATGPSTLPTQPAVAPHPQSRAHTRKSRSNQASSKDHSHTNGRSSSRRGAAVHEKVQEDSHPIMPYPPDTYIDAGVYYVPPQIETTPPSPPPAQPSVGRTIYSRNVDRDLL